jgi:hypothetical protein
MHRFSQHHTRFQELFSVNNQGEKIMTTLEIYDKALELKGIIDNYITEVEISDISECEAGERILVRELHNFMVKGNSATVNSSCNSVRLLIASVPRAGKDWNHGRSDKFFCSAESSRPTLRTSRSPT